MSYPTRDNYDHDYFDYDEDNDLLVHFDSEGGTEAYNAETGESVSVNDD